MRRSTPAPEPVLITTARESGDDEYNRRRKKYAIMMGLRVVCVIAAATTYGYSMWLAMAFVVGGTVLPWCAVIIANDRPAKKRQRRPVEHHLVNLERALPAGKDGRTVDG